MLLYPYIKNDTEELNQKPLLLHCEPRRPAAAIARPPARPSTPLSRGGIDDVTGLQLQGTWLGEL